VKASLLKMDNSIPEKGGHVLVAIIDVKNQREKT
jgi:hypothetical protein